MNARKIVGGAAIVATSSLFTLYAFTQNMTTSRRVPLSGTRSLGAARTFKNLTLVPVYDSTAKATDDFITLDEGLKAKAVKVQESTQGGDVNTLYITNTGTKPLYIMAGEVVLGGQQDRCLGKDLIVSAGRKRVPIRVFCVERGRWSGHQDFDGSAKMVASAGIRSDAQDGAFVSTTVPAFSSRQGVGHAARGGGINALSEEAVGYGARVSEAQSKVWQKVAQKNASFKAETSTGTYQHVLNMSGGEAHKSIAPYVKALSAAAGNDPHLVGAVAAVNGKVIAADIFGDPTLFRKLWPKLLNSYAADAAENASESGKSKSIITQKLAKEFLADAQRGGAKAESKSDVGMAERYESKAAVSYRLIPAARAGGGAGFGASALHENVLGKVK